MNLNRVGLSREAPPRAQCVFSRSLPAEQTPRFHELEFGAAVAASLDMNTLHRCQKLLKQNGIHYAHSIHAPAYTACDVAAAECMPAHELAKVVVYSGDNGFGMLVLPADYSVNFEEVRRLLGLREIRLAAEAELIELFPDCEAGAMPPFGSMFNMPVLLDETLAATRFMAFTAGTHQDVLRMSASDYHALVNPLVAGFAVKVRETASA